jgi:hypothetical protein
MVRPRRTVPAVIAHCLPAVAGYGYFSMVSKHRVMLKKSALRYLSPKHPASFGPNELVILLAFAAEPPPHGGDGQCEIHLPHVDVSPLGCFLARQTSTQAPQAMPISYGK